MKQIFLWFYCLPIAAALVWVGIGTAVYFALRSRYCHLRSSRIIDAVLLAGWLGIVIYATIGQRTGDTSMSTVVLQPFHSYRAVWNGGNPEIYRSNFMNAVLFYPAGLLGAELLPRKWPGWCRCILVLLVFASMSAGIEFLQYCCSLGRCEIDDVIHNAAGALIGCAASLLFPPFFSYLKEIVQRIHLPLL